jgi:hypothetical protein
MRIRLATSALVALGAASACAIGAGMVHQADVRDDARESALRSSTWSVQASTDFGTTWTAPVSSSGGTLPVRVDTEQLRGRSAYQPFTLRTTVDSRSEGIARLGSGTLIDGDPAAAAAVRIRAVSSRQGTCAAPTFSPDATRLLTGDGLRPTPLDAPPADAPLTLPGATRTTAGAPVTICLEVGIAPDAPVADSVLTLAWPLEITRAEDPA